MGNYLVVSGTPKLPENPNNDQATDQTNRNHLEFLSRKREALKQSLREQFLRSDLPQPDFIELLHSLHQCGEGSNKIATLPEKVELDGPGLTGADFHVVFSLARRHKNINILQLSTLHQEQSNDIKNCLANSTISVNIQQITDNREEAMAIFRALHDFGDRVRYDEINEITCSRNDLDIVASLLSRCSKLQYFRIFDFIDLTASQLQTLLESMKKSNIKIKKMIIDYPISHRHILSQEDAIVVSDMLPHVTDEMEIYYSVKPPEVDMIQRKLDSLLPTDLKVELPRLSQARYKWITLRQNR